MIESLYLYHFGSETHRPHTLDEMFAYEAPFQVLVKNQEEKDYLFGLQLMYGRELEVDIWADWIKPVPAITLGKDNELGVGTMKRRRLKAIVFTTHKQNLRGL